jgi:hypothetical protein
LDRKWRIFIAFRTYGPCPWELPNWATKCEFHFQTAWCEIEKVDRKMENIHGFQNISHIRRSCPIGPENVSFIFKLLGLSPFSIA